MKRLIISALWGFALSAAIDGRAQSLEDKVLSGEAFEEPKQEEAVPTPDAADLGEAQEAKKNDPELDEAKLQAVDEEIKGPRQIPLDHILVVQKRFIRKEGRHELNPIYASLQPADSFKRQVTLGFSYVYHFSETLGVEALNASFITSFDTGLADKLKASSGVSTDRVEPVLSLVSTLQWSPLSSKSATSESVFYFEGYFLIGGGVTRFTEQWLATPVAGFGFRAYATRDLLFRAEIRDYMDIRSGGIDQRVNLSFGASVLFGGGG